MKILFFGAKSYDIKSFDAYLDKEEYKDLDVVYIEPNLTPQTAMLAAGYEAVCAFVNMDLSAETIDILNTCKVKLILMQFTDFIQFCLDLLLFFCREQLCLVNKSCRMIRCCLNIQKWYK